MTKLTIKTLIAAAEQWDQGYLIQAFYQAKPKEGKLAKAGDGTIVVEFPSFGSLDDETVVELPSGVEFNPAWKKDATSLKKPIKAFSKDGAFTGFPVKILLAKPVSEKFKATTAKELLLTASDFGRLLKAAQANGVQPKTAYRCLIKVIGGNFDSVEFVAPKAE